MKIRNNYRIEIFSTKLKRERFLFLFVNVSKSLKFFVRMHIGPSGTTAPENAPRARMVICKCQACIACQNTSVIVLRHELFSLYI